MQKRVHKSVTRAVALTAAFALTVSGLTVHTSAKAAAKKAPTLSVSSITLKKGQSKKIKINANKQKIKKVTWKVDKTKLKITKKTKKYVIVKALKKGSASISVTIKTKEKTYTKKIKAQIKKAQKTTAKPKTTKKPVPTKVPGTKAPDASSAPDGPQTSDIPSVSVPPAETAATPTEVPLDTPKPDETKTPDETKAPTVTTPPSNPGYIPPAALEQNGMTLPNAWTNGNGTAARKLMELNPSLSGKRIKFSMELKFCGGSEPAESTNLNIVSNYNSYPTLKTFKMKQAWNKWETVTFIHRFKSFTNSDAIIYFDLPSEMTAYVRKITYTILDNGEPDELGGTPASPDGWNKGQIYNLKKDGDAKFYENKQVNISFDVRVKGVENPTGVCKVQSNYSTSYPMLKTDIPLSKEWEHVDIPYSFGTITDPNPILYFSNEGDITDEMELYIKDVQVNISGAIATPTPRPPSETIDVDINKTVTLTGSQKGEWGGFVYAEFDSPVEIKSTDIVKAKIKVTHDGESTEQAYSMQVGLYTNGSDQFNSLCFTTTGFTSSQLKELVRKETPADKEDKNAVGFAIQNQNSLSTDKDVIVTLVKLQIERVKGSDTPSGTPTPTPEATEAPDDGTSAQDMSIPLTTDNVKSIITTDRTLTVSGGIAKLEGLKDYKDGIAIKVDIPEGVKLQDFASVKCSVKSSKDMYGKTITVAINKDNPSELKEEGALWAYQKVGESVQEHITTKEEAYTIPIDFTGFDVDITGSVYLIIAVAENPNAGNTADFSISNVSLNTPREKTPITLKGNITSLYEDSTCEVTEADEAKLTCTCTAGSEAIVLNYQIEDGKKLQDYKGISFTLKGTQVSGYNSSGTSYGKDITVALNKWDLTKPNADADGKNYGFAAQQTIAKMTRDIKQDKEITCSLDFDLSAWEGDITGQIAMMIGIGYNSKTDIGEFVISNVSLLS